MIYGMMTNVSIGSLFLGVTILVTQLGLLWWETRHVSLSLAYPGLKPPQGRS